MVLNSFKSFYVIKINTIQIFVKNKSFVIININTKKLYFVISKIYFCYVVLFQCFNWLFCVWMFAFLKINEFV